jgi:VWFA-related protein
MAHTARWIPGRALPLARLLLLAGIPIVPPPAVGAQNQADSAAVFRAGVSEVRLDVQVFEGRRVITGLTVGDFEVLDEGLPQPIIRFTREDDPLALLLLIDVSGSMKRFAREMASTAQSALTHLKSSDSAAALVFSRSTETVSDFSNDYEAVARSVGTGVDEHGLPSGTAIYAALLDSAAALKEFAARNPNTRRGILILTDNQSLNFQITDEQVLRALFEADAVLNAIVPARTSAPAARPVNGYRNPDFSPANVFKLAEESGGEAIRVERADRAFPEMVERLRNRYGLHYRAPATAAGVFRRVEVRLTPQALKRFPKAKVRARSGYYTSS